MFYLKAEIFSAGTNRAQDSVNKLRITEPFWFASICIWCALEWVSMRRKAVIDAWLGYISQMDEQWLPLIVRHLRKDLIDLLALLRSKSHVFINPLFLFLIMFISYICIGQQLSCDRQPPRGISAATRTNHRLAYRYRRWYCTPLFCICQQFWLTVSQKFCGSRQDEDEPEISMLRRWCTGELRLQDRKARNGSHRRKGEWLPIRSSYDSISGQIHRQDFSVFINCYIYIYIY